MTDTRNPIDAEVARADGTIIRYTVSGPKSPAAWVLVHGWGCGRHDFDGVVGFLPTVDARDCGRSRRAWRFSFGP